MMKLCDFGVKPAEPREQGPASKLHIAHDRASKYQPTGWHNEQCTDIFYKARLQTADPREIRVMNVVLLLTHMKKNSRMTAPDLERANCTINNLRNQNNRAT